MSRVTRLLPLGAAALALVVTALSTSGTATAEDPEPPVIRDGSVVEVQILALNDFHGNLLPPTGGSGRVGTVDAGGAEFWPPMSTGSRRPTATPSWSRPVT